jgi:hypothetical protein
MYVGSVRVRPDGSIEAAYSSQSPQKANATLDGTSLVFTPNANSGNVEWQCHSDTLKQKWCPRVCSCQ